MQISSNKMVPDSSKQSQQFEALTFPLTDKIYSTALRMTRDQLDAEDLVQNTYLKAYRFFHRFQPGTNFRAWMFRILTNNFITEYKNKKKEPVRVNFETICLSLPQEYVGGFDKNQEFGLATNYEEIFDDKVTVALDKLPDQYRIVILLCDVSDLRYKEISEVLGCPIGTVMSRLNRGRKKLAQSLKEYAITNGFTKAGVC